MRKIVLIVAIGFFCGRLSFGLDYLVTDFGAVGDGRSVGTERIQAAIDACSAAGGGRVVFPAGEFVSGSLFLKSNVEVHLSSGSKLLGSLNFDDYPPIAGRWEGVERTVYSSLLTALDVVNVSISGRGTINGRGEPWWDAADLTRKARNKAGLVGREPDNPPDVPLKWPRPRVINFYRCKNVSISGITITGSPSWTIHPVYCENVLIDGITIDQPYDSPNTDGIDPDSCKNVRIINCDISCGDDCIAIKSGYNEDGRRVGVACENIVIANCIFRRGRGGVTIGSETSGNVRNVTVANCVFDGTLRAVRIKSGRGRGGVVENILMQNLICQNIEGAAISITARYGPSDSLEHEFDETTPTIREISINSVIVDGAKIAANLTGLPESPLSGIRLSDIRMRNVESGLKANFISRLHLNNVSIEVGEGGCYVFSQIGDLVMRNVSGVSVEKKEALINIDNVDTAWIESCGLVGDSAPFLKVSGAASNRIRLGFNGFEDFEKSILLGEEIKAESVELLYDSSGN